MDTWKGERLRRALLLATSAALLTISIVAAALRQWEEDEQRMASLSREQGRPLSPPGADDSSASQLAAV